jgi:hypothetical protein
MIHVNQLTICYKGIYLHNEQIYLTDPRRSPCHPPSMDQNKMTTTEVEARLKLLAEWAREELLMQERREVEREGRLH